MPTDATKLSQKKITVPSEMRTAEWSMLPQWVRERSFYMAGVTNEEILEAFRKEVEAIAAGDSSVPESERRLSEFLDAIGYEPTPGEEGTIHDLRNWRRMRVVLTTNVQLLQGWGQKERGTSRAAIMAFPVWEFVRVQSRREPREWPKRFRDAGGQIIDGRMLALKLSPVWAALGSGEDALGVDYPPFAWGSGMGWSEVGFREAKDLGLIPDGWEPPARRAPVSSPNATMTSKPEISTPAGRARVKEKMKGLADWNEDGDLVHNDPNGTRPMPPEKLATVWEEGMPGDFSDLPAGGLLQRQALADWIEDPTSINEAEEDDLIRIATRTAMPAPAPLHRVETHPVSVAMQLIEELEAFGKFPLTALLPLELWTLGAAVLPEQPPKEKITIRYSVTPATQAADLAPLIEQITKSKQTPQWVYHRGVRFRVLAIERGENEFHIKLEELPPTP